MGFLDFLASIITYTPSEIYGDYFENVISADRKYKGKHIRVRGVVTFVTYGYISVAQEINDYTKKIDCHFYSPNSERLESLKAGKTVWVSGTCEGFSSGGIRMDDCKIEDVSLF